MYIRQVKLSVLVSIVLVLIFAAFQVAKATASSASVALIDKSIYPNGLTVPKSFLGIHLNRWRNNARSDSDELPMPGTVSTVGGVSYFTTKNGYTFYYYRAGIKIKLVGMGLGGKDFETTITALETPTGQYPTVARLANTPNQLGETTVKYPVYVPSFGYSAVRSHDSGVNWATLHTAKGVFNAKLMSAWVASHAGKSNFQNQAHSH
jgi:hypothetical protein